MASKPNMTSSHPSFEALDDFHVPTPYHHQLKQTHIPSTHEPNLPSELPINESIPSTTYTSYLKLLLFPKFDNHIVTIAP
ncbi:hypothetical protein MTR_3g464980 [Medicago truncatula]|uniref:Uncharacterized protein n=1 Tax=Medicago truncatula TaxID=3880 RepID=A0A072UXT7_MEDTR|nr:hypothetical protein MTR_3g464980 [Medicago truncatula]